METKVMAHGYLGDGYGMYGNRDPDDGGRDDDRGRDWRGDWRGEQRGEWRGGDRQVDYRGQRGGEPHRGSSDRDRGFMFGERGDRGRDDGFFSRTADQARDWFREDEHDYRSSGQRQGRGQQGQQNSRFGSHQDDHYLSWRQQQIDALDRDYQDYCQERQQQFHQDFDNWRSNRQPGGGGGGSNPSGQTTSQIPKELEYTAQHDMAGTSGMKTDPPNAPQATTAPDSAATVGTNNSENSVTGRRR